MNVKAWKQKTKTVTEISNCYLHIVRANTATANNIIFVAVTYTRRKMRPTITLDI